MCIFDDNLVLYDFTVSHLWNIFSNSFFFRILNTEMNHVWDFFRTRGLDENLWNAAQLWEVQTVKKLGVVEGEK